MTVAGIKRLIKGTNWKFETYHDYQRDISMEKYNVLINGAFKLEAKDMFKRKWTIYYKRDNRTPYLMVEDNFTLKRALKYCED